MAFNLKQLRWGSAIPEQQEQVTVTAEMRNERCQCLRNEDELRRHDRHGAARLPLRLTALVLPPGCLTSTPHFSQTAQ